MATAIASLALGRRIIVITSIICTQPLSRCKFICEEVDIFERYNSRRDEHVCWNGACPPEGQADVGT